MTTPATFTVGLVQMRSGLTPAANLETATKLIGEAKQNGADYVQTPEMTNIMDIKRERLFAAMVSEEEDVSLVRFRELARKLGIYLHVGSLGIKISPDRAANRSFLIGRDGEILARYDKIHMFDVDLANGESYRESRSFRPGESAIVADLPWGRLGFTICYDLRFPALYRALAEAGASFISIPAAFTALPIRARPAAVGETTKTCVAPDSRHLPTFPASCAGSVVTEISQATLSKSRSMSTSIAPPPVAGASIVTRKPLLSASASISACSAAATGFSAALASGAKSWSNRYFAFAVTPCVP